ncbi:MAG TPA: acyl carrier protein [Polyangiaceae bacterium]|nr:acyl carrier protein [Polyangiaceae bacterium]
MDEETIFAQVTEAIVRSNRDVAHATIHADASLVADLGMDSMRLAALIGELKARFGDVDLTGWYVTTARHGADTVRGLVDFLCRALAAAP